MVRQVLSRAQRFALADRAYRWVQTIRRLNTHEAVARGTELESILPRDDVHMLMLALQHLSKCARLVMRAGEPLPGGKELLAAWAQIKEIRNAFEHEEEHISGTARRQDRLASPDWMDDGLFLDVALTIDDDGLKEVLFMGKRYEVRSAVAAAVGLDEPLLALRRKLQQE